MTTESQSSAVKRAIRTLIALSDGKQDFSKARAYAALASLSFAFPIEADEVYEESSREI